MSYIIKPTNIITGATAPAIVSFAEKQDLAEIDARSKSNLSKYDRWSFSIDVTRITDKEGSRYRKDKYEKD